MAKQVSKFFWTDHQQAHERLSQTYILLGDEPIYVRQVIQSETYEDLTPTLEYLKIGGNGRDRVRLDDERFGRFRKLPVLGWVNFERDGTGVLLERKPLRNRQHGLSDSNTMAGVLPDAARTGRDPYTVYWGEHPRFSDVASDPGYAAACKGEYPTLAEVVNHIRNESTIAISPLFAIHRDAEGLRWLYRLGRRVGVIPGADSILLLDKYSFLREELTEDPLITTQNIREF